MKTLNNLTILITRPAHQAEALADKIHRHGGIPIRFPTLEIVGLRNTPSVDKTLKNLANYDFVLFISPNAVCNVANRIQALWPSWPKKTKVVAIGPGTLEALKQYHLPVDDYPEKKFNSEGVLALALLKNPLQKKILMIKGQGGRLTLLKELEKRGAQVSSLNVYKRQLPIVSKPIPDPKNIDIMLCTSNEGLKNLVSLLYPVWGEILFSQQLLLISQRAADYAKKLGFVKPPLISDNANNEAVLQTLWTYARTRSTHSNWIFGKAPRE